MFNRQNSNSFLQNAHFNGHLILYEVWKSVSLGTLNYDKTFLHLQLQNAAHNKDWQCSGPWSIKSILMIKTPLCLPKKEWLIPLKSLVNKFHLSVLACLIHQLISDKFVLYLINRINDFIAIFYPSSIPPMTLPVIILKMVLHDSSCPLTDTKNRWLGWGVGCVGM